MPSAAWQPAVLVPLGVLAFLALDVLLVRAIIGGLWGTLARRFPARPILPGAVSKGWQSVALYGWAGFNHCLTIAVDEAHLHLIPWPIIRFFGAPPVSIPWESITDARPAWRKNWTRARFGGTLVIAPAWCLELATQPAGA